MKDLHLFYPNLISYVPHFVFQHNIRVTMVYVYISYDVFLPIESFSSIVQNKNDFLIFF